MIRIPVLHPALREDFPPVTAALAEPDGLLCAGGDLAEWRLLEAYRRGIFPWFSAGDPILWWSPDPRLVFETAAMHVPRRLRRDLRRCRWTLRADTCFAEVMRACAAPRPGQGGTWITPEMFAAYTNLHALGHAHSLEVFDGPALVGGIYGVAVGRMFFGESMFSRVPDASKLALWALCTQLQRWGWPLIDCQVETAHLISLGAQSWPRERFLDAVGAHAQPPDIWRADTLPRTPVDLHDWLMAP